MRIAVGGDHPGFEMREAIKAHLAEQGIEVVDVGSYSVESTDYPKYGAAIGELVASGDVDFGIAICGTGIGISISANKVPGVRAALCWNEELARLAREHNDANVLAMGARFVAVPHALHIIDAFLAGSFAGGRHVGRVGMIGDIEEKWRGGDVEPKDGA